MSESHLQRMTPAAELLGRRVLEVRPDVGEVRLSFEARPQLLNRHGTVQGGFLAAMLDSATAIAILAALPEETTALTTELHVSYLRPGSVGTLFAVARIVERHEREARTEGELRDASGNLLARATATLRLVERR